MITTEDTEGTRRHTGEDYEVNRRAEAESQGLTNKMPSPGNGTGDVRIGDVEDLPRKQFAAGTSTPS